MSVSFSFSFLFSVFQNEDLNFGIKDEKFSVIKFLIHIDVWQLITSQLVKILEFLRKANLISSSVNFDYHSEKNNQYNIIQKINFEKIHQLGFDLLKFFNKKETSDIIINVQGIPILQKWITKLDFMYIRDVSNLGIKVKKTRNRPFLSNIYLHISIAIQF